MLEDFLSSKQLQILEEAGFSVIRTEELERLRKVVQQELFDSLAKIGEREYDPQWDGPFAEDAKRAVQEYYKWRKKNKAESESRTRICDADTTGT
jgi:hypothetical protein